LGQVVVAVHLRLAVLGHHLQRHQVMVGPELLHLYLALL
jgi:hypothetical protein